ncbi:MAG TPA: MmcQ/YjbR family DNA-binding protein [Vicinamibacterales bacterium]|nr:MmcQ/YjbR family DNA-binding protein [Vicinamibacterales bacterium]
MAARKAIGFDTIRRLGLAMPDVEVSTTYGSPALKIRKRMFACLATHKSAEPHTLVVSVGFDRRDELIAADPDIYYLKEHYRSYPVVLVRLDRVHPDALRGLLATARRFEESRATRRRLRPRLRRRRRL